MLWTESGNVVDKLIAVMTGQDCGHFALLFESPGGGVVFEGNLLGTHPAFYKSWIKKRKIVHEKDFPMTIDQENVLWDRWVDQFDGQGYDFLGALYCGLMVWRERMFKIPKPTVNKWSKKNTFYCDEVYQMVSGMPGFPVITAESNGMDTPHDVWEVVRAAYNLKMRRMENHNS